MADKNNNKVLDINMARQSLIEELQAQKWYDERIIAAKDVELKKILEHNKNDEKEHESLLLEWLRRNDLHLDKELKEILFKNEKFEKLWD
ncbi:MAG: ferritin [Candidatus Marsarchaeota archaeon]|jgi:Uncharacterized conserved protein|nr:ferritin [Candidatus Marsarchaeota archaeon]MCL5094714.1 ferritin [Candidatus Marsarchaeota archaeon]